MGKLVDDFHDHHHHNQDRVRDQNTHMHMHVSGSSESSNYSPFFTTTDLKLGYHTFQNFPPNLDAKASYFLPKNVADLIPFSLSKLSEILTIFSLPPGSGRAKDEEDSLRACESPLINGETKFYATSLESLVDLIRYSFGISEERGHQGLSILTSTFLDHPKIAFQGFTVFEKSRGSRGDDDDGVSPHVLPLTVFYCHCQSGRDRVRSSISFSPFPSLSSQ